MSASKGTNIVPKETLVDENMRPKQEVGLPHWRTFALLREMAHFLQLASLHVNLLAIYRDYELLVDHLVGRSKGNGVATVVSTEPTNAEPCERL